MKRTLSIAILAILLAVSVHAFAVSNPAKSSSTAPMAVAATQEQESNVFRGIVKKLDEGTALFTDKDVYPLVGGDFETIVGKEVNVIGKVVKEGDVKKILVARVQLEKM